MHNSMDNLIVLLHVFALVFLLALHSTIIGRARKSVMRQPYIVVVISLAVWLTSLIAELIKDDFWWNFTTDLIKYIGICGLCFSVLWLGYVYWRGVQLQKLIGIILCIPALLVFLILSTDSFHGWLSLSVKNIGTDYSIPFIIILFVMILYVICGLLFCLAGIRKQYHDRKVMALLFCAGLLLPVASSLVFLFGSDILPFDITALTAVMSSVLFAYSAMHYQLLDILPIARREIFHEIESALVITRNDGMIIDCNQAFAQIYDDDRKSIIGRDFLDVVSAWRIAG